MARVWKCIRKYLEVRGIAWNARGIVWNARGIGLEARGIVWNARAHRLGCSGHRRECSRHRLECAGYRLVCGACRLEWAGVLAGGFGARLEVLSRGGLILDSVNRYNPNNKSL